MDTLNPAEHGGRMGRTKGRNTKPEFVLHPGRKFAEKLAAGDLKPDFLVERVADYFAGRPLKSLPKAIAEQQAAEVEEAQEAADEA